MQVCLYLCVCVCMCVCVCVCVNMQRDSKAKAPNCEQQLSSEGSREIGLEKKKWNVHFYFAYRCFSDCNEMMRFAYGAAG